MEAGPSLPERLLAARERKGVDLYRAERDTKIRARYLAALEHGEYAELPGAVYTKGFLRNYALYLGLDPEDVIRQWKRERGDTQVAAEPVLAVPKPLAAPRQGLTFSPVLIVAGLLTVLIAAFAVYMGVQLVRFSKPPTLALTNPPQAVIDVGEDTTTYQLRGTTIPGATVTVIAAGREQPYRVSADDTGRWVADVDLRRGRNQFDIAALDPETGKSSENAERVFITVPFLVIEAPTLTVESPAEGAQFENGAIPVRGTTSNAAGRLHHGRPDGQCGRNAHRDASATVTGSVGLGSAVRLRGPGPARRTHRRTGRREGRRGRHLRHAAGPVRGQVEDRGDGHVRGGQGHVADPQRVHRLQGCQPGGEHQGFHGLAQGLGGREGLEGDGRRRNRLQPGQGPDVHREEVGRGPYRQVQRDVLHPERRGPGATIQAEQPADLALRPARSAGRDQPALAMADPLVDLAGRLQARCVERGLTVATAESCTGGLVAHLLTEVPGSSAYLRGGIVAYADEVKQGELGVPAEVLAAHGAVSAQVALAMAEGVRSRLGTDLGVGVTGVAGPDGGSESKPVGLAYVAVAGLGPAVVRRFLWSEDRSGNKRASAGAALEMLLAQAEREGPA